MRAMVTNAMRRPYASSTNMTQNPKAAYGTSGTPPAIASPAMSDTRRWSRTSSQSLVSRAGKGRNANRTIHPQDGYGCLTVFRGTCKFGDRPGPR